MVYLYVFFIVYGCLEVSKYILRMQLSNANNAFRNRNFS